MQLDPDTPPDAAGASPAPEIAESPKPALSPNLPEEVHALWASPTLKEQLPLRFANGAKISYIKVSCGSCDAQISEKNLRGRIGLFPTAASIDAVGGCPSCRVLTRVRCRLHDDDSISELREGAWRRYRAVRAAVGHSAEQAPNDAAKDDIQQRMSSNRLGAQPADQAQPPSVDTRQEGGTAVEPRKPFVHILGVPLYNPGFWPFTIAVLVSSLLCLLAVMLVPGITSLASPTELVGCVTFGTVLGACGLFPLESPRAMAAMLLLAFGFAVVIDVLKILIGA